MLEQFTKYMTPNAKLDFLRKFWERRYRNFEDYLDKLFSLDFDLTSWQSKRIENN